MHMALQKRTSENVLLKTALANFYAAAEEMGLDEGLTNLLAHSERRTCVSIPVEMDDGSVKVFNGYRVLHNSQIGPGKGGVRFHPEVCLDECEALAFMMTWKCSLAGIPYGGGKGGVDCDPLKLSPKEKERICRTFAARINPVVDAWTDVPAPDVGTNGQDMVWFMDTISKMRGRLEPAIFTGKPVGLWGAKGRNAATGLGVATCAKAVLEVNGKDPKGSTAAVQGFGNVGSFTAKFLVGFGTKVVAISDITGCYYCENGINVQAAIEHVEKDPKHLLTDFEKSQCGVSKLDGAELIGIDCDVLLPCALEGAINAKNVEQVKAKFIVEGANGPTTPEADEVLAKKGVIVVPDFLANSAGVIGSYYEWCQDLSGDFWTEEQYNDRLVRQMTDNFMRVWNYAKTNNKRMRRAAFLAAIDRVVEVAKTRGLFL